MGAAVVLIVHFAAYLLNHVPFAGYNLIVGRLGYHNTFHAVEFI